MQREQVNTLPLGQGREVVRAALWLALVAHCKYRIPFGDTFGATIRWINYAQRKADMAWQEQPEWKARRERRRAAGLCPRCGKVPVPPGAWACEECKARYRQYWRQRQRRVVG